MSRLPVSPTRFPLFGVLSCGYVFLLVTSSPYLNGKTARAQSNDPKSVVYEKNFQRSTEEDLGPWIWPFTENQINAIVDTHNDLRRIVEPDASDMMKMVWDEELAMLAQNWSEGCVFAHPSYPVDYGQNLATHSDIVTAIYAWFSETAYYDYETMTCEAGKMCGHYTQVVWAPSYQVGCGIEDCGVWHITTCNYRPAGNSPGNHPYQNGYACSQCPSPSWCEDRLCNPECKIEGRLNCDCTLLCLNCAVTNHDECTCSCKPGWMGIDCADECADTHNNCGVGWPDFLCGRPGWEFVDDFCVEMCGHCDAGPYDPVEHCCNGLECATGLVDGNTCECQCFEDRGEELSCDLLLTTTRLTTSPESTVVTRTDHPASDPASESSNGGLVLAFVITCCIVAYVILAACLTWKLYLSNNKVYVDERTSVSKDSPVDSRSSTAPIIAWTKK